MLQTIVIISHVLLAITMILLILLQQGKGATAGAGFGAGASGTVFGAQGSASFLSRATAMLATLFFVTSLTLAYFASQGPQSSGSIMEAAQEELAPIDDGLSDMLPVDGESDIPLLPQTPTENTSVEVPPVTAPDEGGDTASNE
ncbi:MAG: preprotein translocase subunit SecG [Pseudomonadota bacterium]